MGDYSRRMHSVIEPKLTRIGLRIFLEISNNGEVTTFTWPINSLWEVVERSIHTQDSAKYHATVHDYWNGRIQHISISYLTTCWVCAILNYNVLSGQKDILHCISHFLMTFGMSMHVLFNATNVCVCQILKIIKILSLILFFLIWCAFLLI